jgi:hypothetical protein
MTGRTPHKPMIYVYRLSENRCITHDGDVEIGIFNFGVETYQRLAKVENMEVYWKPDPYRNRYKRANFQRHEKVAGKDALENLQGSGDRLSKYRTNRV